MEYPHFCRLRGLLNRTSRFVSEQAATRNFPSCFPTFIPLYLPTLPTSEPKSVGNANTMAASKPDLSCYILFDEQSQRWDHHITAP